jgi:hypothetical protein
MELVNPDAEKQRLAEASQRYFSDKTPFLRVGAAPAPAPKRALPPVPEWSDPA